jgi:hypothetical protein
MQTPTQTTRSASGISSLKTRVLHIATQSLVAVSRFQLFSRWSRVVAGRLFANKQLLHATPPKLSIHPSFPKATSVHSTEIVCRKNCTAIARRSFIPWYLPVVSVVFFSGCGALATWIFSLVWLNGTRA